MIIPQGTVPQLVLGNDIVPTYPVESKPVE